ncbi:hypothetical protein [Rhodovibrio salinarum]|uniref:Uncharacterized protein n=1 Tax=Rhodovibrio salinarum TaxID=1087 RepID=A0A934QNG2_9PROT|nr:hypothetical protein [Rhodovibrio salinarum]MBK1699300.1 hypothetical protein [Rhodovibrio salinarum]
MSRHDVYGRRYWSVSIYQARLLFFLPADYVTLRELKDRAEKEGGLSLKKLNWEKLHVLGLLEVDRTTWSWVMVRQGPLWRAFWDALDIHPAADDTDISEQLRHLDNLFADASQNTISLPHLTVE